MPKPDTDVSSSQENGDLNEEEVDTSSDEVKKKRHPDGIAEMLSQVGTRFHPSLLFPPSLPPYNLRVLMCMSCSQS